MEAAGAYLDDQPLRWAALLSWAVASPLGGLGELDVATRSRSCSTSGCSAAHSVGRSSSSV